MRTITTRILFTLLTLFLSFSLLSAKPDRPPKVLVPVYDETTGAYIPVPSEMDADPVIFVKDKNVYVDGRRYGVTLDSAKDTVLIDRTSYLLWLKSDEMMWKREVRRLGYPLRNLRSRGILKIDENAIKGRKVIHLVEIARYIRNLDLSKTSISDRQVIREIAPLRGLDYLSLRECTNITDKAIVEGVSMISNIEVLDLAGCDISDEAIASGVANLKKLTSLNLANCSNVTESGIKNLTDLSELEYLNLNNCGMNDSALDVAAQLPKLRYLDLGGSKEISDTGIAKLTAVEKLTYLNLRGCVEVTDESVTNSLIAFSNSLMYLNLAECTNITDEALLLGIGNMRRLTYLNLTGCDTLILDGIIRGINNLKSKLTSLILNECKNVVDEDVIDGVSELRYLERLGLQNCERITDDAIIHGVARLSRLSYLNVRGCVNLTDDAVLAGFSQLKRLSYLDLRDCANVSADAIETLKKILPDCYIHTK